MPRAPPAPGLTGGRGAQSIRFRQGNTVCLSNNPRPLPVPDLFGDPLLLPPTPRAPPAPGLTGGRGAQSTHFRQGNTVCLSNNPRPLPVPD